jgi:hypothetical protein
LWELVGEPDRTRAAAVLAFATVGAAILVMYELEVLAVLPEKLEPERRTVAGAAAAADAAFGINDQLAAEMGWWIPGREGVTHGDATH